MALPVPAPSVHTRSTALVAALRAEIAAAGGWIAFSQYMARALYHPDYGYYSCGAGIFGSGVAGSGGDFVTAPELTPLFGRTLARSLAPVLQETAGDVLELGAGRGRLAADLLPELDALGAAPRRYYLLEVSAALAAQQRDTLARHVPQWLDRIHWLTALPDDFCGVMFGNEVLDALPVELVHWTPDGPLQRGVVATATGFDWHDRPFTDAPLAARAAALDCAPGYVSELCPAADALVSSLADRLRHGAMLWIDYGFRRDVYYHPQRDRGTLRAHYRQHALDDPFYLPGGCDLTAHVDFSAVEAAGLAAGLTSLGLVNQAGFLIDAGVLEVLRATGPVGSAAYLAASNALNRLLSPAEMGELFQVIGLTRGLAAPLPGFARARPAG